MSASDHRRIVSDRALIARSLESPQAFETLFERHAAIIHRYLRRRVGETLAETLVAETFAQAFRHRRRFDGRQDSALPWLYGIVTNLLKMHRRSAERRLRAYARVGERDLEHPLDPEADARLDAIALRKPIAEALASLPRQQREVILLHAWAELSNGEIAVALGISSGAVRNRLHRARAQMAKQLARSGNEPVEDATPALP
jgi:RNA polymerase sigma factor (sigma-70 family)